MYNMLKYCFRCIIPCMYDKQTFNKIQLLHIIIHLQSQINKKNKKKILNSTAKQYRREQ